MKPIAILSASVMALGCVVILSVAGGFRIRESVRDFLRRWC